MGNKEKVTITWSNSLVKYSEIETSTVSFLDKQVFFLYFIGD